MTNKRKVGRPKGVKNKEHVEESKAMKIPLSLVGIFRETIKLLKTKK